MFAQDTKKYETVIINNKQTTLYRQIIYIVQYYELGKEVVFYG